jgi:serine/threonine-protein kinase
MSGFPVADWDDVGGLIEGALDRPHDQREAFLAAACGADAHRLDTARRLLAAAERAESFLETPAAEIAPALVRDAFGELTMEAAPEASGTPTAIGPYRVLRRIGRGGMAEVFLAERADDEYRRRVAIKIVRAERGGDLAARFRHERQVLASLEHPHIARLYDGGMTADGRPYLVMEYVDGRPIDRYADETRLSIDGRLALFDQVCGAVARAHRNLIAHRDLKPGNVFVSADGTVKLLDFGVAKLIEAEDGPDDAPVTRAGMRVMTPEYASPEQFRGDPVTTATDVYSLGVLLYELLTGVRPNGPAGASARALQRAALERDPDPPSLAAARAGEAAAAARGSTAQGLRRRLQGDLDNIVLKALEKDADRRYASVDALADDLGRHRCGLPVSARGDSIGYRAGRFLRRHRAAAAGAAAVVVLVTTLVAYYSVRLATERDRARLEAQSATRIAEFVTGLFRDADPIRSADPNVTARELLQRGAARLETELGADPDVQARLLTTIGLSYRSIGLLDESVAAHERALESRRARLGPDHPEIAESLTNIGGALYYAGRYDEARRRYEEALRIYEASSDAPPEHVAETLNGLGLLDRREGQLDRAAATLERALALRERALGADDPRIAPLANNLGLVHMSLGNHERALALFDRAADLHAKGVGPDSPLVAGSLMNAGDALARQGEFEAALPKLQQALAIQEQAYGPDHRDTATAVNALAGALMDVGRYEEALPLFSRAERAYASALGPGHPYVAYPIVNAGDVYWKIGDHARALAAYERALAIREAAFGAVHRDVAATLQRIGALRVLMHDCDRAVPVLERAIQVTTATTKPLMTSWIATAKSGLGACASAAARYADAEALLLDAHQVFVDLGGPDSQDARLAADRLVTLYETWGKPEQAAQYRLSPVSR